MKNELKQIEVPGETITRKQALQKLGKYVAFTAVGTMILLSPKKSQAESEAPRNPGGRPFD